MKREKRLGKKCKMGTMSLMDQEDNLCSYFACGLDPFPDAEVADDPRQQKTQSQLPSHSAQFVNTICESQDSLPVSVQEQGEKH